MAARSRSPSRRDESLTRSFRRLIAMFVVSAALTAVGPGAIAASLARAAGTPAYQFDISVETPCVSGRGPADQPLTAVVRSQNGAKLGSTTVGVGSNGHWAACFPGVIIEPGMSLTARHAGQHRRLVVPPLTLRTDRPSDVLSGRAPVGQALRLTLTRCVFTEPCLVKHYAVTPDSAGHYADDVSAESYPWDLEGGDRAVIGFTTDAGDSIHADSVAELMRVVSPDRVILQIYPPGSTVSVRLLAADGSMRATQRITATTAGPYAFRFVKDGKPVTIQPGNAIRASFSPDARITWPHVRLVGHPATGHVSGVCLKDMQLQVTVGGSAGLSLEQMAGSDGSFDVDFSSLGGVQSGDVLHLVCRADTGDRVEFQSVVP